MRRRLSYRFALLTALSHDVAFVKFRMVGMSGRHEAMMSMISGGSLLNRSETGALGVLKVMVGDMFG